MSYVLDVVQNIVLHGAYELTCAAAVQVFNKCKNTDESTTRDCEVFEIEGKQKSETINNVINMELENPAEEAELLKLPEPTEVPNQFKLNIEAPDPPVQSDQLKLEIKPVGKELESSCPILQSDVYHKMSGPICAPKCSCMRVARDSYFS